ncbi:hypothetical protein SAMN05428945_1018 [Streptomyces sp. 2224.1]|uniref:hypothetical protein n=1 Tax=unclassified Streptomyces TaxID=2593676 RepID=UPI000890CAEC|nr:MULTISPECIES: hypothetical protein [unclassified Streptomyces]PBC84376.1 hypothetical protein BX261_4364 [Streptomyces sp. 2321.6]SDR31675.1 hypothetical protein SAMN05216511_2836 [Streptomyces sp. KS_16]SEB73710.1 hypothetical protein SAMN05428945_1018 [Streptomyces sp. 2224.1]SED29213.1 hypothetical protein SAMN05428940_4391 [Streptomyces sp. 2133.1]SNC70459.1 hypothetical protein SAMN06272741_4355 [Streptomyces sp. 2114.4]
MTRLGGSGNVHNSPTAHGDHSIAANDIKNVIVKWVMHPSARWLPLLLACTAVVIAGTTQPGGPAGQYTLWGALSGLALLTGAARVLNRRPRDARVVGTLSLVSVLATVGGWLAFQHVVAHGEIDVTGSVRIQGTQPLDGETNRDLTLLLDAPALKEARDALRLTLAINDHDPAGPTCLPDSATVSLLASGVAAQPQRIRSHGTVDFALGAGVSTVRINVTLHTDRGCRMDISATDAVLHDR